VLGARRASLWVYTPRTGGCTSPRRRRGRREGTDPDGRPESATAWVFRERQAEPGARRAAADGAAAGAAADGREAFLSVPINYTPPKARRARSASSRWSAGAANVRFSAGDSRLLSAIASQIGAALETQRLVQDSLRQERSCASSSSRTTSSSSCCRTRRVRGAAARSRRAAARRLRRRRLLPPVPAARRPLRHHDRRRVEPRLLRRADHGADHERRRHLRAGVRPAGRGAARRAPRAHQGARVDRDVPHALLRRARPERRHLVYANAGTRTRSTSTATARRRGSARRRRRSASRRSTRTARTS
jgi:hypothetical protein